MEDLKRAIALLFKRKGKEKLTEKEFVFSASMDLRWFSPKEAQRLLDLSREAGLLSSTRGELALTFDLKEVEVPMDFTPSAKILEVEVDDIFQRMVAAICSSSGRPKREVVSTINGIQEHMGVYGEMAALIAGRRFDVDMSTFYDEVEDLMKGRRASSRA